MGRLCWIRGSFNLLLISSGFINVLHPLKYDDTLKIQRRPYSLERNFKLSRPGYLRAPIPNDLEFLINFRLLNIIEQFILAV